MNRTGKFILILIFGVGFVLGHLALAQAVGIGVASSNVN